MRLFPFVLIGLSVGLGWPAAAQAPAGAPQLRLPIACDVGRNCEVQNYVDRDPGPGVLDYHCGHRTYQGHDGVDIRVLDMAAQRAGVEVLAAAPGRVSRLRDGVADISIRAPGAPSVAGHECGNGVVVDHGGGWETQYCHMARGSLVVKVGDTVAAGQPLGRVGLSGDTEFPHLHFLIRHGAQIVDPFGPAAVSPGACPVQAGLWTPQAAAALAYRRGAVLNVGFAAGVSAMDAVEDGGVPPPGKDAPAVVAYARLIGLEAGDVVEMRLLGPGGAVLAAASQPIGSDKAQWLSQVGRKRPASGWPPGAYAGEVSVRRAGSVALSRQWRITL